MRARQRKALGLFCEKAVFNACVKSCYVSLEEKIYDKSIFHYKGFGPGGDTSIPPVLVLKSTLPHFGIST